MTIGGGEALVWRDAGVSIALALWRRAAAKGLAGEVGKHGQLAVQQRQIDVLTLAGLVTMAQRGKDGDAGMQTCEEVSHCHADLLWAGARLAIGHTRDTHQSTQGLGDEVIARPVAPRPRLAKAGDGANDEAWFDCHQIGRRESMALKVADLEVLDQD